MASATLSDPLLHGMLVSALVVMAVAVALLAAIALLRLRLVLRERRTKALFDRWRPRFAMAAAGDLGEGPTVDDAEGELLLPLWNQLRESVRGASEASLDAFAHRIGLQRVARALLASGNTRSRLLAINTLGHLCTTGAYEEASGIRRSLDDVASLLRVCGDRNTIVSLAAVRALLRIDSTWALPGIMPLMLERTDWSIARLLPMLRSADATQLESELAGAFPSSGGVRFERLLLLAAVLPQDRTSKWARMALEKADGEEQIAAALRLVSDPRDAPLVCRFLKHPAWPVRVRAVHALERVAGAEDVPQFVEALADSEWWVRLRAARALVRLPFLDGGKLARLRDSVSDRYARDALIHALAEAGGA